MRSFHVHQLAIRIVNFAYFWTILLKSKSSRHERSTQSSNITAMQYIIVTVIHAGANSPCSSHITTQYDAICDQKLMSNQLGLPHAIRKAIRKSWSQSGQILLKLHLEILCKLLQLDAFHRRCSHWRQPLHFVTNTVTVVTSRCKPTSTLCRDSKSLLNFLQRRVSTMMPISSEKSENALWNTTMNTSIEIHL